MLYVNFLLGIVLLLLGIPIGNFLSRLTKEELKQGQRYFKSIVILSLVGVLIGLIFRDDVFLFSFSFIAIVTSRSLKND
jgi:hypothetical protein